MSQVRVNIKNISAERFWDENKSPPQKVQISTSLNIVGLESKEGSLSMPFVVNIGYNPSVAQITFRGDVQVKGEKSELDKIREKYEEKEKPPNYVIQNVINKSIVEATILSRTLNIPPPVPLPSSKSQGNSEASNKLNYVG